MSSCGTALTYAFFKGCDIRLARTTGCFELLLSVSFRALTWNILDALKKTLHPWDTCDSLLSGHSPLASSWGIPKLLFSTWLRHGKAGELHGVCRCPTLRMLNADSLIMTWNHVAVGCCWTTMRSNSMWGKVPTVQRWPWATTCVTQLHRCAHGELGGVERWEFPILHNCCKVRIGMWKTYFFASSEELRALFPFGIIRLGVSSLQMLNFVGLWYRIQMIVMQYNQYRTDPSCVQKSPATQIGFLLLHLF